MQRLVYLEQTRVRPGTPDRFLATQGKNEITLPYYDDHSLDLRFRFGPERFTAWF